MIFSCIYKNKQLHEGKSLAMSSIRINKFNITNYSYHNFSTQIRCSLVPSKEYLSKNIFLNYIAGYFKLNPLNSVFRLQAHHIQSVTQFFTDTRTRRPRSLHVIKRYFTADGSRDCLLPPRFRAVVLGTGYWKGLEKAGV